MQKTLLIFIVFLLVIPGGMAQNAGELLLSGPMVGYTEMREALLWVQTNGPAQVQFEYVDVSNEQVKYKTEVAITNKATAFTARLIADQVKPGVTYNYTLIINGTRSPPYPTTFKTPPIWQFRSDPPEMKIAWVAVPT